VVTRAAIAITACVAFAAAAVETVSGFGRRSGWRALEKQLLEEVKDGSLQGLLRARVAAARVLADRPDHAQVIGQLAFVSAWLADEYGLRSGPEAEEALARLTVLADHRPADADSTRALLALSRGDRTQAASLALATSRQDRHDPRPLLVLARARALAGDPLGASKAAEAAVVRAPKAGAPLVSWAEARLDLGQLAAAKKTLHDLVLRVPEHSRALLLLQQTESGSEPASVASRSRPADRGAGAGAGVLAPEVESACTRDGAVSPVVATACDLMRATARRTAGQRGRALEHLRAVPPRKLTEPRQLARAALLLAQAGRIDEAEALASQAARLAAETLPMLAWARLAITLGRGELALPPPDLTPSCAETRLVAARATLAAGGPGALADHLKKLPVALVKADADLLALAQVTELGRPLPPEKMTGTTAATGGTAAADPTTGGTAPTVPATPGSRPDGSQAINPVQAYALGIRSRLAGDAATAVLWLASALEGHGDACRAAGEYTAAARLAGHQVTTELDHLRAMNTRCLNLTIPPPPPPPRKPRTPRSR
jgi:hypothetical protein